MPDYQAPLPWEGSFLQHPLSVLALYSSPDLASPSTDQEGLSDQNDTAEAISRKKIAPSLS